MPAYPMPALPSDDKRWKIVNGTMRRNGYTRTRSLKHCILFSRRSAILDDDAIRFVSEILARSSQPGLRRGYFLSLLQPQARRQAHLHHLHRHRLLHQGRRQAACPGAEKLQALNRARPPRTATSSLMTARCVGACGRAPVVLGDGELVGLIETPTDGRATGKVGRE